MAGVVTAARATSEIVAHRRTWAGRRHCAGRASRRQDSESIHEHGCTDAEIAAPAETGVASARAVD
jgi:hypothetical protein